MPHYTLATVPCWSHCGEVFLTMTEMQDHHFRCHEALLDGQSVLKRMAYWHTVWLARDGTPPSLPPGEGTPPMGQTAPRCRQCGGPVPDSPDHLRLQLCGVHMMLGFLAFCVHCKENHPEHGVGGRGCASWQQAPPEGPIPGLEEDDDDEGQEAAPASNPSARCGCSHAAWQHPLPTSACTVDGCGCPCFGVPVEPTALDAFQVLCQYAQVPYRELEARLLLERLGVPPEAAAVDWQAGVHEAVSRWRGRQLPVLIPRRM